MRKREMYMQRAFQRYRRAFYFYQPAVQYDAVSFLSVLLSQPLFFASQWIFIEKSSCSLGNNKSIKDTIEINPSI